MEQVQAQLDEAKSQNGSNALVALGNIAKMIVELNAQCSELALERDRDTVHDPLFMPAGVYRVTLKTGRDNTMRLEGVVLEGTCEEYYEAGDEFRLFAVDSDQDASGGIQAVFRSSDCTVVWNTWWVSSPYTVTFEKLQ